MKVAFNIFALTLLSCFVSQVLGLQLILSTRDPHCVNVAPERTGAKITVTYTITGVNEDQISFKATQGDDELVAEDNIKDWKVEFRAKNKKPVNICWTKLDRKSKKVNFLIQQEKQALDEKASADTVEGVIDKIDNLAMKLDQISQNVAVQIEVEKSHFIITQDTTTNQAWMSFIKYAVIVIVCGAQIYMTTSFFSKGGAGRRTSNNDINPFSRQSI
jgi:hypothetical protein